MKPVAISVVIPTRHRNDLLALCLDRLVPGAQSLPADEFEVIVTDDGARSTARDMIENRYPWVRWIDGPRRGPASNRNNGARLAAGEFVAFTDDDCLPGSGWLRAYADAVRPDIDVYEGKTTCDEGVRSPLMHAPMNLTGGWLWSCNMMVRKTLFEKLGGFDEDFPLPHMEDTDLRRRLVARGISFVFVPDAVVDHPPRLSPPGRTLAMFRECDVVLHRKWNERPLSLAALLYRDAKHRVRGILRYPFSVDSLRAAAAMLSELAVIALNYNHWLRKHDSSAVPPHPEALANAPQTRIAPDGASHDQKLEETA